MVKNIGVLKSIEKSLSLIIFLAAILCFASGVIVWRYDYLIISFVSFSLSLIGLLYIEKTNKIKNNYYFRILISISSVLIVIILLALGIALYIAS